MTTFSKERWDRVLEGAACTLRDQGLDLESYTDRGHEVLRLLTVAYHNEDPRLSVSAAAFLGDTGAAAPERKTFIRHWNAVKVRRDESRIQGFVIEPKGPDEPRSTKTTTVADYMDALRYDVGSVALAIFTTHTFEPASNQVKITSKRAMLRAFEAWQEMHPGNRVLDTVEHQNGDGDPELYVYYERDENDPYYRNEQGGRP